MQRGFVKVWRKVKDSGLYQLPETFTLFMYILTEATHQPRRVGNTLLQRGQYSSGRIELSRQLKQSEQTVRTGLSRLKKLGILTIETTSHGSIYTIVNYNIYQDNEADVNQRINQPLTSDQPATNQPLTSNQPHNKHKALSTKNINTLSECSDEFDQFWNAWPTSKRKGGKVDCVKFWKTHRLDEKTKEIIAHVAYCKSNGVWRDEQFIEAPIVYLRAFKWSGAEIGSALDAPYNEKEFMRRVGGY